MTNGLERHTASASPETGPRVRSLSKRITLAVFTTLAFFVFVALGTWQLQRLQWKLALIERVEQRVHAPPAPAPGPERWPQISAASDEYRHVQVSGNFLYDLTTQVQAVTELGSGYWLLTPLRDTDGNIFLVNRGFVPANALDRIDNSDAGQVTITGLLRISEPGGGFLRHNDPVGNRWYSRDVQAIAAARGLSQVAPYFVDADAKPTQDKTTYPVGGLTVITFHNSHLVYALTWYAMALMVVGAAWWFMREERKPRH